MNSMYMHLDAEDTRHIRGVVLPAETNTLSDESLGHDDIGEARITPQRVEPQSVAIVSNLTHMCPSTIPEATAY